MGERNQEGREEDVGVDQKVGGGYRRIGGRKGRSDQTKRPRHTAPLLTTVVVETYVRMLTIQ